MGQNRFYQNASPTITASKRVEFISDVILSSGNNFAYTLPGGYLPNDRFMFGLRLYFAGRMTNAASGNPTGVQAEAPFTLIENIKVEGYHRIRGQREQFINVRGSDIREWVRDYTGSAPFSVPTTALALTANATNDIEFTIDVPFTPLGVPLEQQLGYLLDAPNYDSLVVTIQFSDDKSVFTGQTLASTFSTYASASGNAKIRVSGLFAMGGPQKFAGFVPARLWRYSQEIASGDIVGGNTKSRLFNIPKGYSIRALQLKTGIKSTTVTAGNNAYNTLSYNNVTNVILYQGINRQIRNFHSMDAMGEENRMNNIILPTTGYCYLDFANDNLFEVLKTQGLVAGTTGDVDLFLQGDIVGASNQAASMLVEELRGAPRHA